MCHSNRCMYAQNWSQNYSHQDIIEPDTKVNVSVINGVWGWGTYGDGRTVG